EKTGESNDTEKKFEAFGEKAEEAERELNLAENEMKRVKQDLFPQEFQKVIVELREKLPLLEDGVRILKDYSRILSPLLGEDSPKRYLIIFQNSSEIRPTGGFIGSYAILEVANDTIKKMEIRGIYDADGQLSVNVIPPKPLQHISSAWSTHDANWFFDFPASAKKISWFFEKTGEEKIDGVMSLNIELIEKLLTLTGPVGLPEYNLTLDAQNFRDEVQYEVEVGYDKKINRPKQVLADFTPLFLVRLYEVWQNQKQELFSILADALEEKNIMLFFKERESQKFFEEHGWTGSMENAKNSDYLAVAHINIGGYKTSRYMEQEIIRRAKIKEDGTIVEHLLISQSHKGGDSKYWWYNKPNIDYVKIYVPKGAKLVSSTGGKRRDVEKPVDYRSLQFVEDPEIETIEKTMSASGPIDIFEENGKTVFATWVVTKAKAASVVEIEYTLPFRVELHQGKGAYRMYFQKQAGTSANARSTLTLPENWRELTENPLEQSFILDKDREIQYTLRR
ncbi:MAG: DUF4012 domain-containing protein, partial [Candidatus Spechtbacteria bacterium]|nr:DUF4012 domain-containing protein [Candidatus Spechtbacteria bacterium]